MYEWSHLAPCGCQTSWEALLINDCAHAFPEELEKQNYTVDMFPNESDLRYVLIEIYLKGSVSGICALINWDRCYMNAVVARRDAPQLWRQSWSLLGCPFNLAI